MSDKRRVVTVAGERLAAYRDRRDALVAEGRVWQDRAAKEELDRLEEEAEDAVLLLFESVRAFGGGPRWPQAA